MIASVPAQRIRQTGQVPPLIVLVPGHVPQLVHIPPYLVFVIIRKGLLPVLVYRPGIPEPFIALIRHDISVGLLLPCCQVPVVIL